MESDGRGTQDTRFRRGVVFPLETCAGSARGPEVG